MSERHDKLGRTSPATILVAEDARDIREFFIDAVLRPAGYEVIAAVDGREALRAARETRPDLIVADWQMPGMSGLDLKRALAALGDETPLILITGQGSESVASEATLAGVASYLPKPVDIDVMLAAVEQALRISWLRRERAAALEALEKRVHQLETLQTIAQALTASLDLTQVLTTIVDAAIRLTGAEAGSLIMLEEGGALALRAQRTPDMAAPRADRQLVTDALAVQVIGSGRPALWTPWTSPAQAGPVPAFPALYVPLRTRERAAGVLAVDNRTTNRPFGEADLGPLSTLADYGSAAIANAQLFAEVQFQSVTDALSGLYNRRHFFTLAERELQRATRYHRPLSALMFDIDHFKRVNDSYGHATGDQVIAEIARRCYSSLRRNIDILGRYGGEEFAAILPETDVDGGRQAAERLRNIIASTPIRTTSGLLAVTVSLGVAGIAPGIREAADLLQRADAAMYAAKQAGRNRVMTA